MEMEDNPQIEISDDKRKIIEWLKQFRRTQGLQDFVINHKFSKEELAFLRLNLLLTAKTTEEKSAIEKWA